MNIKCFIGLIVAAMMSNAKAAPPPADPTGIIDTQMAMLCGIPALSTLSICKKSKTPKEILVKGRFFVVDPN